MSNAALLLRQRRHDAHDQDDRYSAVFAHAITKKKKKQHEQTVSSSLFPLRRFFFPIFITIRDVNNNCAA